MSDLIHGKETSSLLGSEMFTRAELRRLSKQMTSELVSDALLYSANTIEAQAKRIAELEAENAKLHVERDAMTKALWKAKDWLEEEEGRSLDKILEDEARYNDRGLIGWNPHYIQLVRFVAAAIKGQA